MARHTFGGSASDWIFAVDGTTGDTEAVPSASILFFTALSSGAPITDLLDITATAETFVTTDSNGYLPTFSGPDTTPPTRRMAADANGGSGPRYWIYANDLTSEMDTLIASIAAAQTAVIDTTAADIQPNGVQTAGAVGKLPDAGHIHPAYENLSVINPAASTQSISLAVATFFDVTLTANVIFTFTGAVSGKACSFTMRVIQGGFGSFTATWPSSVKWPGGTAPVFSTAAGAKDLLTFISVDNGVTWDGNLAGKAYA